VGDKVFMKLQPYTQTSVARRSNHKLSFKYFGPYEILERIGKVAYRLKLPAGSQIHPVLHVSQLKKMVPPAQVHDSNLSFNFMTDELCVVQPEVVHQRRFIKHGRGYVPQVLVSWTLLPSSLKTWESEAALLHRFPDAPAWGQAASQGGGNATGPGRTHHRKRDARRAQERKMAQVAQEEVMMETNGTVPE
jgi:hypothetical protein